MELYLVRHAIAGTADPAKWPDDRDRPLTAKGEERFRTAARGLRKLVSGVDGVLSSRFVRAWQTAEILERQARWPAPQQCEALEGGRDPAEILQALQPYSSARAVALVGHEPGLHELAAYLLSADTGHVQLEMKKGGIAHLAIDEGLRPGTARLVWLLTPRALRALASD
jgi:phosphohistidine phosphatase